MNGLPTASCLLYLFADRWLPGLSLGKRLGHRTAVPTPGTGTLVELRDLEDYLLAVAVWDLASAELIALHDNGARSDLRRYRLTPTGEDRKSLRGIEGHLLRTLPDDGSPLYDLVWDRWMHPEWSSLPLNALVLEAQIEAAELDIIGTPPTPEFTPSGHYHFPPVEVDAGGLARLEDATDGGSAWEAALDDGTINPLIGHCDSVITALRPSGRMAAPDIGPAIPPSTC